MQAFRTLSFTARFLIATTIPGMAAFGASWGGCGPTVRVKDPKPRDFRQAQPRRRQRIQAGLRPIACPDRPLSAARGSRTATFTDLPAAKALTAEKARGTVLIVISGDFARALSQHSDCRRSRGPSRLGERARARGQLARDEFLAERPAL
jgi:hypothetical protein